MGSHLCLFVIDRNTMSIDPTFQTIEGLLDILISIHQPCHCQADVTFSSDNLSHREQTEPMPMQYSDLRV